MSQYTHLLEPGPHGERRSITNRVGPVIEAKLMEITKTKPPEETLAEIRKLRLAKDSEAQVNSHALFQEIMESGTDENILRARQAFNSIRQRKMSEYHEMIPDDAIRTQVINEELMIGISQAIIDDRDTSSGVQPPARERISNIVKTLPYLDQGSTSDSSEQAERFRKGLLGITASLPSEMQFPYACSLNTSLRGPNFHPGNNPVRTIQEAGLICREVSPDLAPYFVTGVLRHSLGTRIANPHRRAGFLRSIVHAAERLPENDRWYMHHHSEKDPGIGSTVLDLHRGNAKNFQRALDIVCDAGDKVDAEGKRCFYYYTCGKGLHEYRTNLDGLETAFELGIKHGNMIGGQTGGHADGKTNFYFRTLPIAFRTYGDDFENMDKALGVILDVGKDMDKFCCHAYYRATAPRLMEAYKGDIDGLEKQLRKMVDLGKGLSTSAEVLWHSETVNQLYSLFGDKAKAVNPDNLFDLGAGMPPEDQAVFFGRDLPRRIESLSISSSMRNNPGRVNSWTSEFASMIELKTPSERLSFAAESLPAMMNAARYIDLPKIPAEWRESEKLVQGLTTINRHALDVDDELRKHFIQSACLGALHGSEGNEGLLDTMLGTATEYATKPGIHPRAFYSRTLGQAFITYQDDIPGMRGLLDFTSNLLAGSDTDEQELFYMRVIPAGLRSLGKSVALGHSIERILDAANNVDHPLKPPRRADYIGVVGVNAMQAFAGYASETPEMWQMGNAMDMIRGSCETLGQEARQTVYQRNGFVHRALQDCNGQLDALDDRLNMLSYEEPVALVTIGVSTTFGTIITNRINDLHTAMIEAHPDSLILQTVTEKAVGTDRGSMHRIVYVKESDDSTEIVKGFLLKNARGTGPADEDTIDDIFAATRSSDLNIGPIVYATDPDNRHILEEELPVGDNLSQVGDNLTLTQCCRVGVHLARVMHTMIDNNIYPNASNPHPHPIIANLDSFTSGDEPDLRFIDFRKTTDPTNSDIQRRIRQTAHLFHEHLPFNSAAWNAFRSEFIDIAREKHTAPRFQGIVETAEFSLCAHETGGWHNVSSDQFRNMFDTAGIPVRSASQQDY